MQNLRKLFAVLDRWKGSYLFAGSLLILAIFVQMLEPKMLQVAIDGVVLFKENQGQITKQDPVAAQIYAVLPSINSENLSWVLICIGSLLVVIASIKSLSLFAGKAIAASSTEKAAKSLRDKLFGHIQLLPLSHFSKVPSADMIQRCTGDITTVRTFIGEQIVEVIRFTAIFCSAFTLMYITFPLYAFICIAIVPLILITAAIFFQKESVVWQEHEKAQDKLTGIIQENLSGIRVVQAFAKEDYEIEKFVKQNIEKRKMGLKNVNLQALFWPFSDFLVNAQISVSILAGAYFVLNQQISLGEFVSFLTYSIMVTWPMRGIGRIVSQAGMAAVAMERIQQVLDAKEEDYTGKQLPQGKILGNIEFRNVSFQYTEDGPKILNDLSFSINTGENIAIMGAPGAGKSTIIALLARFYEPTTGEIFLDGTPLNQLDKSWLRKRLGIVEQKPFLFSTTVKNNIFYQKQSANEADLKAVADASTVSSFIQKLTKGYDTVVGEKGVTLSGGQKQRVALARTLLGEPDVLILDDSTSAIDTETEYKIQQALKQTMKDKTSLIIAHRLTSIQQADRIFILDKGTIIEQGTHTDLLLNEGFYKKIYDLQVAIEEDIEQEM